MIIMGNLHELQTQYVMLLQQSEIMKAEIKDLREQNKLLAHEKWELEQKKVIWTIKTRNMHLILISGLMTSKPNLILEITHMFSKPRSSNSPIQELPEKGFSYICYTYIDLKENIR